MILSRRGPLEEPELGLLEAEMSRVFGLGYSWPDTYTQCVLQTLLYSMDLRWVSLSTPSQQSLTSLSRLPYDKQQCGYLLSPQPQDEGEDLGQDILFVPEPYDDIQTEDTDFDSDSKYNDEELQAWLQLQNVSTTFSF